jgi:hypothetical protein
VVVLGVWKNGYGYLYQWPLICFHILLRNNCHIGDHFENKMAAIALKFVYSYIMIARHWGRKAKTPTNVYIYISNWPKLSASGSTRCLESSPHGGLHIGMKSIQFNNKHDGETPLN